MRSPDHRQLAQPRAGRHFEDELQLRYLAPGAFTVLPPTERHPPDPPHAPEPYRLTPTQRRHKNQSFAIIGEVDSNRPPSRSSSPSGRVSPFRGRGFNASGSRHVSPVPSPPPPDDARLTPTNLSPRHVSKIPQLKRRGSNNFGEKVYHYDASPTKRKISNKLSSSMTNLDGAKTSYRPPPSPKRTAYSKAPAFQTLSPIIGSSPEPSQSMSSPSRIPKSRSTPPSRKQSPTRNVTISNKPPLSKPVSRTPSRSQSRNQSRVQSRNTSREPSPTKNPLSPTRSSSQKYKNVQAKVNTFNKPKVLPKPQVLSEQSDSDSVRNVNYKKPLNRKESVNRLRTTNSKSSILPKTDNYSDNNYSSTSDSNAGVATKHFTKNIIDSIGNNSKTTDNNSKINNNLNNVNLVTTNQNKDISNISKDRNTDQTDSMINSGTTKISSNNNNSVNANKSTDNKIAAITSLNESRKSEADSRGEHKSSDIELIPSATTVVSSTTTTATQPLKIETNLPPPPKQYDKSVSPMVDGRVLSATSVSNAINKMNDTVLDSQTLMKDQGFSKLSSSTHTVVSAANDVAKTFNNPALDTKNATTALPQVEPILGTIDNKITNNNHTNHIGHVMSSKALEMEVQKNLNKLISPENNIINNKLPNDKIKEARTVIASDVQPIRINVRGKPSEIEVQSGNVRMPSSISNGLSERPGLPPAQQSPPNEPEKEQPPKNGCSRFLVNCKRKMTCDCCKKKPKSEENRDSKKPTGCFSCLKKDKIEKIPPARLNVENESEKKPKLLDRLKCCGKQKVGDSSCFPLGKRKGSLIDRRGSIFSSAPSASSSKCSKDCCKNLLLALCCVNLCCKKKVIEEPMRKLSDNSKKKSLTPTTLPPPEDTRPKIDMSLVEHNSLMKGAIPILPVWLAWFCLVMNCILPGSGTVFSGLFCLCIGIPRFSQKDGPKPRIGSFFINTIMGIGQLFTVLFCLVGWGWSIWWGVIMLRVARKHRKFKHLEKIEETTFQPGTNARNRDPERK